MNEDKYSKHYQKFRPLLVESVEDRHVKEPRNREEWWPVPFLAVNCHHLITDYLFSVGWKKQEEEEGGEVLDLACFDTGPSKK